MPVHGPQTGAATALPSARPAGLRLRVARRPTPRHPVERAAEPAPPTATPLTWTGRWVYEPGPAGAVRLPVELFAGGTFDRVQIVRGPTRAGAVVQDGTVVVTFRHNGHFSDSFVVRVSDTATRRWATATIDFDVAANPHHPPCWG